MLCIEVVIPRLEGVRAELVKRFFLISLTTILFIKMFVLDSKVPWQQRFELFSVPAQVMPFGDFRNVQTAAYCQKRGYPIYGTNACNVQGLPVREIYPDAHTSVLNYPPVWVRLYAWLDDGSERYFLLWGRLNACLLLVTIIWLTYRRNALLAPLMLFSPPVLLCVERGNIDATTFAALFLGLSFSAQRPFWRGVVLMVAAGLKLFPLLAVGAWLERRALNKAFGIGLLLGGLALIEPLALTSTLVGGTSSGFYHAFGLWCFRYVSFFQAHPIANIALLLLIMATMGASAFFWGTRWGRDEAFARESAAIGYADLSLCLASLMIFVGTYLLFFNWAYRIIFVLPAVIVLSRSSQNWARCFCLLALALLWSPVFSMLWRYFDVGATVLAILASGVIVAVWIARRGVSPVQVAEMDAQ